MKIRDSGMPDDGIWTNFFDVPFILSEMEIDSTITDVAEIGHGYGTFTIPAAPRIGGTVYAFDIDRQMKNIVEGKVVSRGIKNIHLQTRDVLENSTGLPDRSVDYVVLFNILHHEPPKTLLNEAYRVLKPKGKVGIIHWRSDITTPRGPSLDIRPTAEQIIKSMGKSKFQLYKNPFLLKPYHYGLILSKP